MASPAYVKSNINAQLFGVRALTDADFFPSNKYFLTRDYFSDGDTFLDIGGASGAIADYIKRTVADIQPTIIDPDPNCIDLGRAAFPDFQFVQGYFPEAMPPTGPFDIVSMQALFPQIPNWKEMLLAMRRLARKHINIAMSFRLTGTTVIDKDVSYFYYLDSGERVHQVIHNIYEFVNFCCIHEMGIKKIEFFGYHTPKAGHNFRCLPNSEVIKGNLMLTCFDWHENPKRVGGAAQSPDIYDFFVPEFNIIIDGKPFDPRC